MRVAAAVLLLGVLASPVHGSYYGRHYCQRGRRCWPTAGEVDALSLALEPEMPRLLQNEPGLPYASAIPTPIPAGLPEQPLFGLGLTQMKPLYERTNETFCPDGTFDSDFCKAAAVNRPRRPEDPDFVVFPLTGAHVATAVKFAKKHRLCIGVAGTGHEFNSRNQPFCNGGSILIRTTLMRSKEADLNDTAGLGHPSFRFGAGMVFSEAHAFAAAHGMLVASGFCPTVGLVGWSLGGGHGPMAPKYGLGSDNLIAADIVLADGRHVTVSANSPYSDLFRALKGGGGSTWGILTSITVKAHPIPEGGLTSVFGSAKGDMCNDGAHMRAVVASWNDFSAVISQDISLSLQLSTSRSDDGNCSNDSWELSAVGLVFSGPDSEDVAFLQGQFTDNDTPFLTVPLPNYYALLVVFASQLEPNIHPTQRDRNLGGTQVQREEIPTLTEFMVDFALTNVGDALQTASISLTGNVGSPQADDTSLSSSLRTALVHFFSYQVEQDDLTALFGPEVYLSESSFDVRNIAVAYYGRENYQRLLSTKRKYDPRHVFGCRGCVGTPFNF